jgi:hypothetical protein
MLNYLRSDLKVLGRIIGLGPLFLLVSLSRAHADPIPLHVFKTWVFQEYGQKVVMKSKDGKELRDGSTMRIIDRKTKTVLFTVDVTSTGKGEGRYTLQVKQADVTSLYNKLREKYNEYTGPTTLESYLGLVTSLDPESTNVLLKSGSLFGYGYNENEMKLKVTDEDGNILDPISFSPLGTAPLHTVLGSVASSLAEDLKNINHESKAEYEAKIKAILETRDRVSDTAASLVLKPSYLNKLLAQIQKNVRNNPNLDPNFERLVETDLSRTINEQVIDEVIVWQKTKTKLEPVALEKLTSDLKNHLEAKGDPGKGSEPEKDGPQREEGR